MSIIKIVFKYWDAWLGTTALIHGKALAVYPSLLLYRQDEHQQI